MARYDFVCSSEEDHGVVEIYHSMSAPHPDLKCEVCNFPMRRVYGIMEATGNAMEVYYDTVIDPGWRQWKSSREKHKVRTLKKRKHKRRILHEKADRDPIHIPIRKGAKGGTNKR